MIIQQSLPLLICVTSFKNGPRFIHSQKMGFFYFQKNSSFPLFYPPKGFWKDFRYDKMTYSGDEFIILWGWMKQYFLCLSFKFSGDKNVYAGDERIRGNWISFGYTQIYPLYKNVFYYFKNFSYETLNIIKTF